MREKKDDTVVRGIFAAEGMGNVNISLHLTVSYVSVYVSINGGYLCRLVLSNCAPELYYSRV